MAGRTRFARCVGIALIMSAIGTAPFVATTVATAEPSGAEAHTTVIGDRVWNDKDADGKQEVGEGGINGVTVHLLDKRSRIVASAMTEGNGNYRFEDQEPGVYYVRLVAATLPNGYEMTHDFDGGATEIARLTLRPGHVRLNLDFGYRKAATSEVHDVVWMDLDADGDRDPNEPGLANVEIVLSQGGDELDRVVTRRNGYFRFDSLPVGEYELEIDVATLSFDVSGQAADGVPVAIDGEQRRVDLGFDVFGLVPLGD